MNYACHILVMINIYVLLGLSLNIVVGYRGLVSFCHAAFYGIGAYAVALLTLDLGIGFPLAILLGVVLAVCLSIAIGVSSLRLRHDYFVLSTLAFQVIVFAVLYNWTHVTLGPEGIVGIPVPCLFGLEINTPSRYLVLSSILVGCCVIIIYLLTNSPFGRTLRAIREDELAALALGKNAFSFTLIAFAIAAGFASISGGLFAGYMRYIDPTCFTLAEAVFILSIVIIGGSGNTVGPIVGAVLMVLLPEGLRFLRVPDALAANLRQIIYGCIIILLMRFRPQGVCGDYSLDA